MAAHHFKLVSADPDAAPPLKAMNAALLTAAEGDWAQASEIHASIIAKDPDNYVVRHRRFPSLDGFILNCIGREQPVRCTVEPREVEGGACVLVCDVSYC